jgi:alkaline phosphatase D
VPQINQWDDHEVTNNWYPGEILTDARYTEKRVDVLAARAEQAYLEWLPLGGTAAPIHRRIPYGPLLDVFVLDMRTVKDPNDGNTYADPNRGLLGRRQREWLIEGLRRSRATWKVIAADLPIGLVVPDGTAAQEGVACTTRPRTTTTRRGPRCRTSPRSGSSSPGPRTPAPSGRTRWTPRSGRRRSS